MEIPHTPLPAHGIPYHIPPENCCSYPFHPLRYVIPYSVFYPQQIKNLTSSTPAKKLLPSVANTFRGRANAHANCMFYRVPSAFSPAYLSSPKEASRAAKAQL